MKMERHNKKFKIEDDPLDFIWFTIILGISIFLLACAVLVKILKIIGLL